MTYKESEKILNDIRRKDEALFRMSISHLIDVGIRHLSEESIAETCNNIMKRDDSNSFVSNKYLCDVVRTAGELSKIDHIHLLTYIGRNVDYYVGDWEKTR